MHPLGTHDGCASIQFCEEFSHSYFIRAPRRAPMSFAFKAKSTFAPDRIMAAEPDAYARAQTTM